MSATIQAGKGPHISQQLAQKQKDVTQIIQNDLVA